ncbi:MAG: hypothetical protein H6908_02625 [Hyphomicrobiales bacterium]|nr:hypothetical protein [Rickettsiales bacterium]MCP5361527.1 hypothetical protein [Hyphomicrobiales bacterium]
MQEQQRRAFDIESYVDSTIHNEDKTIYSNDYHAFQRQFIKRLAGRFNFDCTEVVMTLSNLPDVASIQRHALVDAASYLVRGCVRKTDQMFAGGEQGNQFMLLLPGTGRRGAETVMSRLKEAFVRHADMFLTPILPQFQAITIYEPYRR